MEGTFCWSTGLPFTRESQVWVSYHAGSYVADEFKQGAEFVNCALGMDKYLSLVFQFLGSSLILIPPSSMLYTMIQRQSKTEETCHWLEPHQILLQKQSVRMIHQDGNNFAVGDEQHLLKKKK